MGHAMLDGEADEFTSVLAIERCTSAKSQPGDVLAGIESERF